MDTTFDDSKILQCPSASFQYLSFVAHHAFHERTVTKNSGQIHINSPSSKIRGGFTGFNETCWCQESCDVARIHPDYIVVSWYVNSLFPLRSHFFQVSDVHNPTVELLHLQASPVPKPGKGDTRDSWDSSSASKTSPTWRHMIHVSGDSKVTSNQGGQDFTVDKFNLWP